MKKEIIKSIINVLNDEDKVETFMKECKEMFKATYLTGSLNGWYHHLVANNDSLIITGALSTGTMVMSSYKGESITFYKMGCNREIETVVTLDDIYGLLNFDDEEIIKFTKHVIEGELEDFDTLLEEYNGNNNITDRNLVENGFCHSVLSNYYNIEGYFKEMYEDSYNEQLEVIIDYEWEFESEKIYNSIKEAIESLENELEMCDE